jgi:hypothetical protein
MHWFWQRNGLGYTTMADFFINSSVTQFASSIKLNSVFLQNYTLSILWFWKYFRRKHRQFMSKSTILVYKKIANSSHICNYVVKIARKKIIALASRFQQQSTPRPSCRPSPTCWRWRRSAFAARRSGIDFIKFHFDRKLIGSIFIPKL